jgi:hypothetical protein
MLLELLDGMGESAGVFVAGSQDVEGEALGGLGADAGELAELFDEAGHGFGETGGHAALQVSCGVEEPQILRLRILRTTARCFAQDDTSRGLTMLNKRRFIR